MWLLDTARSELHFFSSPADVTGGYAILSHTWGDREETFQDVQDIRKRCDVEGTNPRDFVCPKIRGCCIFAESQGYKWVWIDTCCIDKTSSSELSEAINSMFGWYARSEMCYAFLADVPSSTDLRASDSPFRSSRWHTRGWTLQELIAPSVVLFLSSGWQPLGTRAMLAPILSEITLVPESYLTHAVHHSAASVVERMTWVAMRRTTRIEDEAYCLMGLFDVSIPITYGDGPRAFKRLQLEIMRSSMDTTLFVWGPMFGNKQPFNPVPYDTLIASMDLSFDVYLLAPSPRHFSFRIGEETQFTPVTVQPRQPYLPWQWAKVKAEGAVGKYTEEWQKTRGPFGSIELPHFESTSYGVKCHLPIIEIPHGPTIAVLLCETSQDHIGLLLYPSPAVLQDHTHRRYNTGYTSTLPPANGTWYSRLISLGGDLHDLRFNGESVHAHWRDIYIIDGPSASIEQPYGPDVSFLNCPAHTPFRIPHWLLSRLHAMNFRLMYHEITVSDSGPLYQLVFQDKNSVDQGFQLNLGTGCTKRQYRSGELRHWVQARPLGAEYFSDDDTPGHDCATDHVANWPDWAKEMGDVKKKLLISFTRCRHEPETTLELHLELGGEAWTRLMADAHVSFPTREELRRLVPRTRPESAAVVPYRSSARFTK